MRNGRVGRNVAGTTGRFAYRSGLATRSRFAAVPDPIGGSSSRYALDPPPPAATFHDLDVAALRHPIWINGHEIATGAMVAVLLRHKGGAAYEVEVAHPVNAVVTVAADDLEAMR